MIIPGTCYDWKRAVLESQKDDVFMLALFTELASLGPMVLSYSNQEGEVSTGNGYVKGGKQLSGFRVGLQGAVAFLSFSDVLWEKSTIRARGALVYNKTRGNQAVSVIDFGKDVVSTNGPFVVPFPMHDAEHAFIALE